jgi:cation transport ATPase
MGIVARRGDAVERLAEIDTVVFDKTGTLTLPGDYEVALRVEPAWQGREPLLRWLLREAELASNHPLARALRPLWIDQEVAAGPALRAVRILPGVGIEASFDDGTRLFSGKDGRNIAVRVNDHAAASIELTEKPGAEIAPAVAALEALGIQVALATGDAAERADALPIATRLARLSPAEKHAYLAQLHQEGRKALFAGDGLNDAAAMAWSHVACAAPHSTELVNDISGLLILHHDWRSLAPAIALARKTRQVIRWNIAFSLAYNIGGIAAAATGWLHPVACALLMTASSLTVLLYSMHLMDWEQQPTEAIA